MDIKTRLEKVLSELLSEQYEAEIKVTFRQRREEDVSRMSSDTLHAELSQCS